MIRNALICFGTRYGSTAEVADFMASILNDYEVITKAVNLTKEHLDGPLSDYDLVIIGSGIQAGQWTKEPIQFIEKNLDSLAEIKTAIFVVCGFAASESKCEFAQREFLDKIAAKYPELKCVSTGLFGGVFDFKKYNRIVRALVKRIVKSQMPSGEEVPERIDYRDWDKIREWTVGLLSENEKKDSSD